MEYINKVELKGNVGTVNTTPVGEKFHTRMSVATMFAFHGKDGCAVVETTWHTVSFWKDDKREEFRKGDPVHVIGRLRAVRYTDISGSERTSYEVMADSVKPIKEDQPE